VVERGSVGWGREEKRKGSGVRKVQKWGKRVAEKKGGSEDKQRRVARRGNVYQLVQAALAG